MPVCESMGRLLACGTHNHIFHVRNCILPYLNDNHIGSNDGTQLQPDVGSGALHAYGHQGGARKHASNPACARAQSCTHKSMKADLLVAHVSLLGG